MTSIRKEVKMVLLIVAENAIPHCETVGQLMREWPRYTTCSLLCDFIPRDHNNRVGFCRNSLSAGFCRCSAKMGQN